MIDDFRIIIAIITENTNLFIFITPQVQERFHLSLLIWKKRFDSVSAGGGMGSETDWVMSTYGNAKSVVNIDGTTGEPFSVEAAVYQAQYYSL